MLWTEDSSCMLTRWHAMCAGVTQPAHLVFQGMAMPQTGDGTGTATATGTITLTGTNAVTNTTALASDIEVLPSPAPSCVSVSLFKCLHCPFTSKKKFNVKRHIRQQHDQQAVTCEGCNRRCRNQYYLQWYHKPKCPSAQLSTTV